MKSCAFASGADHCVVIGVWSTVRTSCVFDRISGFLLDKADLLRSQRTERAIVMAVERDGSILRVVVALNQSRDGRFPGATRADECNN